MHLSIYRGFAALRCSVGKAASFPAGAARGRCTTACPVITAAALSLLVGSTLLWAPLPPALPILLLVSKGRLAGGPLAVVPLMPPALLLERMKDWAWD